MAKTVFLKILFALLTGYLLLTELLFYLSQPTHTTSYKEHFNPSHYPDITICAYPQFDFENLVKHGYTSPAKYSKGQIKGMNYIGWRGIENETIENLLQSVSTFKTLEDCPKASVWSKDDRSELNITLTRPTFLNGRCCNGEIQEKDDIPGWNELRINPRGHMNKSLTYKVFLSDKQSAYYALTNKFKMIGDTLITSMASGGNVKFAVKIKKYISLQEDPKAECKNYKKEGYSQCLGMYNE